MKKAMPAGRQGFTLVELLVVVAIVGLLSGMVVISVQTAKAKARDAQRVTDMNNIATALALYHNNFNSYPVWAEGGNINSETDPLSTVIEGTGIITSLPLDPLNHDSTGCGSLGGYYYYYQSTDGSDFYLGYCLETNSVSGKSQGENFVIP